MPKNICKSILLFLVLFQLIFLTTNIAAQSIAEVKLKNNLPTLLIDGKVYPPFAYMSYLGEKKYYKEIAAAGIHLYNIPAYLAERGINSVSGIGPFRTPIWIGKDQYDFSSLINYFNEII